MAGTDGGTSAGPLRVSVTDASEVAVARDTAVRAARRCGLGERRTDTVALVTTELAENLHRHATGGELLIIPPADEWSGLLTLIAIDRGPGVNRFDRCLVDGYSTRGTLGAGLGAVLRLSDEFDAVSEPGRGTVVSAAFSTNGRGRTTQSPNRFDADAVGFPVEYEHVNGDTWASAREGDRIVVLLADGLGHGEYAAAASRAAATELRPNAARPPAEVLGVISERIAGTRGAAVTLAGLDLDSAVNGGSVVTTGLGNVSVLIAGPDGHTRRLATAHGTAGAGRGVRIHQQTHEFPARGLLILHTDGLSSRWSLDGRAELLRHRAIVIAAALWRDHQRGRDDTFVVVVKPMAGCVSG